MTRFKILSSVFLLVLPLFMFAQPDKKHAIILTTGLVDYFYEENKNNFSAGLTYQYRPFKAFAFDGFYPYSQSNSNPGFFYDKNKLHDYILSQNVNNFTPIWSEVYTHLLGLRVHYSIINTNKWHLSLNFAHGVSFSKSSYQGYKYWSWHPTTGQIIDYELADGRIGSIWGDFTSPGLQLLINVFKDFIFGISRSLVYFKTNKTTEILNSVPVWPDFINFSIMVGKIF